LQRAWDGWQHWSRTPLQARIAFLTRLAELLEERAETYGRLITAEMGKPLADSIFEIKKSAWDARHLAETGESYLKPQPIPGIPAQIIYESVGPIFSVQPWNVPFWQVLRFFNTTAIVGNTAIIKHAESVQGCAEALEAVVRDAGGPDGLYVNLAIQVEACAAVIADPRVRAATVTGSVRAGRAVAAEAGAVGKRVVLELGGSDPFIVLEDADLVKAGARVLTGGEIPDGPGNFYPPTVLIDLPPESAIAKEEFFGPVAVIYAFRTEAEAVELANGTDFGLGAAVWSRDSERANRLA